MQRLYKVRFVEKLIYCTGKGIRLTFLNLEAREFSIYANRQRKRRPSHQPITLREITLLY